MTQTIEIAADHTASPIRALHSLTPAQADQIVAGLSSLAAAWTIERHESCDGQLSLVISCPADDIDLILTHASDTSLVVDRNANGIRVSLMLGDALHTTPERHTSITSVVRALKDLAGKKSTATQMRSA